MQNVGNMELKVTINTSDVTQEVKKAFQTYQSEADRNTITYKIAGDKSSLEEALNQIKNMSPEVKTKINLDLDKSDYNKEMNALKSTTGKTAEQIGKDFKAKIETSLEGFDISNIIGKKLKKGDKLDTDGIKKIKDVIVSLKQQTEGFDLTKVTSITQIEEQTVALSKLLKLTDILSKHTDQKSIKINGETFNFAKALEQNESQVSNIMQNVGSVIHTNASKWMTDLENTFNTEFNAITTMIQSIKDGINSVLNGDGNNSGGGNNSEAFKELQKQIDETTNKIKEAETELEKLNVLKNESFRERSQRTNSQNTKNNDIYKFYNDNQTVLNTIEEDPEFAAEHSGTIETFKTLVQEYINLGGKIKELKSVGSAKVAEMLGFTDKDFSADGIAKQIEEVTARLNQLKEAKNNLIEQQNQISKESPKSNQNHKDEKTPGASTPTTATVSPELSEDFKQKLQEKVTGIGSVEVTVSGKPSETFKDDVQANVNNLGTVNMGVSFIDKAKDDKEKQKIPVDVIATPNLSDTFKDDLQKKVDDLGTYEVKVDLKDSNKEKNTDESTLINVKPNNIEEFKSKLKSGVEGEAGLDIKVNPIVADDFNLEIKNATLKEVKIEGNIIGGNYQPASVEAPISALVDGENNQDALNAKLDETKEKEKEVGEVSKQAGEQKKRSLLEIIKEYETLNAESEKLIALDEKSSNNNEMQKFFKKKQEDAKEYKHVQELIAKIQSKVAEKTSKSATDTDKTKQLAGIVAYVERLKELTGNAFSYNVLGENGEAKFNEMKQVVDATTASISDNQQRILELNRILSNHPGNEGNRDVLLAAATNAEKLELKLYETAKSFKANGAAVNTTTNKFKEFLELWKQYKNEDGTGKLSEFTDNAKLINATTKEYNKLAEAEKKAKEEEQKLLQGQVNGVKNKLHEQFPDVDLKQYTSVFDEILAKKKVWTEAFAEIKNSILSMQSAANGGNAGIPQTPQTPQTPQNKPINLGANGEINVIPKVEDPAAFANNVTQQLKGVSADINIKIDQATLENLTILDKALNEIISKLQKITDKTLKVNVDYSSITQLSQADENGVSTIDSLKNSIDGLQTGVLKELGTALSSLDVKKDLDIKITNLAIALGELKEVLKNISPDSNNFLNTLKELSNQASGLKDLATVIRASKEEIQKAKGKIAEGATKASNPKDASKQRGSTATATNKNFSKEELEDRETKILGKTGELKQTIEEANGIIKSITSFYDSEDNLIKTQVKAQEKIDGVLRNTTYTTGYSRAKKDQEGVIIKDAEAFASSISSDEYEKGINEQVKSYYSQIIDKLKQINQLKKDLPNMGSNESEVTQAQIKRLQEQVRYRKQILETYDSSILEKYKQKEEEILRLTGKDQSGKYSNERNNAAKWDQVAKQQAEEYQSRENEYIKERNRLLAEGKQQEEEYYKQQYAKNLAQAYADAERNVKAEIEYVRERNRLIAEGKKQEEEYYKQQERNKNATKYAGKESDYEKNLRKLIAEKGITRGDATFKDVKVDSSGKTIITFLELVGEKARETKITLEDVEEIIKKISNNNFDPKTYAADTTNWRKATKAEKGDPNNITGITNAYNVLIKSEERYQLLLAKRKNHTATPEQKDELVNLVGKRAKARKVLSKIPEGQELKDTELSKQKEYVSVQEQVNAKKETFAEKEKQIHALLEKTNNLMSQFKGNDIQGFDQVFERAKNQVSELNKKLQTDGIKNIQTGYEDKINKIVSSLKNVVAVTLPGDIQTANQAMLQYASTLNNGNVQIGNFTSNNKVLTASFEQQKGTIKEVALVYDELSGSISLVEKGTKRVKSAWTSFVDGLKKRFESLAQYLLTFVSFYRVWGTIKQGVTYIKELDSALTEMRKVSDETVKSLKNFQKVSFDIADAVGTTAVQIQNSTADFMRIGEALDEAAYSASVANTLLNVSEFEAIDDATDSLIAMSSAYKELDKMTIVDKLNTVGNNYAISTDGLATALQKSASALKTASNDMDEAIALITAGNAVVQDPDSVGAAMRTIALRLTGTKAAKEELEELGEEADGVITTTSKLRDTIMSATKVSKNGFKGFDILDENGNYKSTYEILKGISEIYQDIVETDKNTGSNNMNLLLETMAGKNRANVAASILQNNELLESVYDSSANDSEGSAQEELDKYLDSIEGKMQQFKNEVQEFWYNLISSDTVKGFVDFGTNVIDIIGKITDKIGLLGTTIVSIYALPKLKYALKGGGRAKKSALKINMPPNKLTER